MTDPRFRFMLNNAERLPGTWRPAGEPFKASVTCPHCGQSATLREHSIDSRGYVSPSLVCPGARCDFHEYVILEEWPGHE